MILIYFWCNLIDYIYNILDYDKTVHGLHVPAITGCTCIVFNCKDSCLNNGGEGRPQINEKIIVFRDISNGKSACYIRWEQQFQISGKPHNNEISLSKASTASGGMVCSWRLFEAI